MCSVKGSTSIYVPQMAPVLLALTPSRNLVAMDAVCSYERHACKGSTGLTSSLSG